MEPIIFKGLRIAGAGSALLALCVVAATDGGALIATVAGTPPTGFSWDCAVEDVELVWRTRVGAERPVAPGFDAACDPAIDTTGRSLYFSGRRSIDDGFQIWRLDLDSNDLSSLSPVGSDARHPIALPDGSVAFISGGELYRQAIETEQTERLTYTRGHLESAAVLPDGRFLYLQRFARRGRLFSMLPDGTWSTLWPGLDDVDVRDFAVLDRDRLLVLDADNELWLTSIADPFAPRTRITADPGGTIRALRQDGEGGALAVAESRGRSGSLATRAVSLRFEPELRFAEIGVFESKALLAIASANPAPAADILPSIVKPEMDTGFLFVIDVARTDDPALEDLERDTIAELRIHRWEESGDKTPLFTIEPAADGSVYVEAPADTPLTLEMIDLDGEVLASTQTPIWIRPNERRGCIGCHVSPAYAPPNIRPEALVREPHRLDSEREAPR